MYESGYSLRMFQIIENDLVNFFNYVPIDYYLGDKRKNIVSPKLSEFLIRIGSQVDIFFKNWDIVHNVYRQQENVPIVNFKELDMKRYKDIERVGEKILSDLEVRILLTGETLTPFAYWTDTRYPLWWKAYNSVKHEGFTYRKEGNLFNVIESLSALFLLNCIHEKTQLKLAEYEYLKIQNLDDYRNIIKGDMDIINYPNPYITSQIFEFERY